MSGGASCRHLSATALILHCQECCQDFIDLVSHAQHARRWPCSAMAHLCPQDSDSGHYATQSRTADMLSRLTATNRCAALHILIKSDPALQPFQKRLRSWQRALSLQKMQVRDKFKNSCQDTQKVKSVVKEHRDRSRGS